MANVKRLTLDYSTTGLTVYVIIRREADNYRLNDADGAFALNPADPYLSLTEDSVIKGRYEVNESRTVWSDGRYTVAIYQQAGGSPAPVSDTLIGSGEISIVSDIETASRADQTVDLVWDEVLSKATHNIAQSAGKRLRQLGAVSLYSGTATGAGNGVNQIVLDAGASAVTDIYYGALISIVGGTGAGQAHHILAYNGATKTATIDDNWITAPDATSDFEIIAGSAHEYACASLVQSATNNTAVLSAPCSTVDNFYNKNKITIASGTGAGQTRYILSYVGATKTVTVDDDWTVTPDATSAVGIDAEHMADVPTLSEIEASTVLAKQAKLDFAQKWILNKLVVNDASVVLYDDDGVTPLKTWARTATIRSAAT